MHISNFAIVPLYVASFIMLAFQYFRVNPARRVLDLRFGLMAGAVILMLASVALSNFPVSPVLFLLALFWLGLTLYLFGFLPPPRH